jgi:hypothetical protein
LATPEATPLVTPSTAVQPSDGGLAELWRNLLPLDDLQAKSPPERRLVLGKDILPSLAILTAQGPGGPKLINADLVGKLATANLPYFIDSAASPAAAGTFAVNVHTPSFYSPGMWMLIGTQFINGQWGQGQTLQVATVSGNTVTTVVPFALPINANDPIILIPPPIGVFGALRKRRYDWTVSAAPGVGVQAIATIPQRAGWLQIIDKISADQINGNAALFSGNVTIQNPAAIPTAVWTRSFITQAVAGDREHIQEDDMSLQLPDAANNTVQFSGAPPAGAVQDINVAGWYEPQGNAP